MSEKFLSKECQAAAEAIADVDYVAMGLPKEDVRKAVKEALGRVGTVTDAREKFLSGIINGMLSGTMTPIANGASVVVQQLLHTINYGVGAMTDAIGITKGDRALRDVAAMVSASMEGFASDVLYFKAGFETGNPLDIRGSVASMARASGKTTSQVKEKIINHLAANYVSVRRAAGDTRSDVELAEGFKKNLKITKTEDSVIEDYLGENYDYIRNVWGDGMEWVNIPTKLSVAVDEYGKARFRRMKIAEMASRKARQDAKAGKGTYSELYKRYQQQSLAGIAEDKGISYRAIQKDFSKLEANLAKVFGTDADDMMPYQTMKDFALDKTFQSQLHGALAKAANYSRQNGPLSVVMGFFMPFIKTPWNIVKDSTTYVPGLGVITRPAYKSGTDAVVKMSKDELIARQVVGASMFVGVGSMFASGMITGNPRNPQERQQWKDAGIPAQSIRIGDQWVSYARFEPVATGLGLMSDFMRIADDYMNDPDMDNKNMADVMGDSLYALKENITSKTFMKGLASLFEFVESPDRNAQQVLGTVLKPLVPAAVNEAARLNEAMFGEGVERQAVTPLEQVQKRIPYFREKLPPDYGAYGGARKEDPVQAITGVSTSSESARTDIQREVAKVGAKINRPQDRFKKVDLTSEQLSELRRLSSIAVERMIGSVISSEAYQKLPESRKRVILEARARKGRALAGRQFIDFLRKTDPDWFRKRKNQQILSKGFEDVIGLEEAE